MCAPISELPFNTRTLQLSDKFHTSRAYGKNTHVHSDYSTFFAVYFVSCAKKNNQTITINIKQQLFLRLPPWPCPCMIMCDKGFFRKQCCFIPTIIYYNNLTSPPSPSWELSSSIKFSSVLRLKKKKYELTK